MTLWWGTTMQLSNKQRKKFNSMIRNFTIDYVTNRAGNKEYSFSQFQEENPKFAKVIDGLETESLESNIPLEEIIYELLEDEQKNGIGTYFKTYEETNGAVFDEYILGFIEKSKEYQSFLKASEYLTKQEKEEILGKIARDIYDTLSEEHKKKYSQLIIKRHVLGLGFIHIPRSGSYKQSPEVIIKYPALFNTVPEVVDRIMDRYIEEYLHKTDPKDTTQALKFLEKEVKRVYHALKKC